ncbi:GntR family transcriptional regulator [Bacillus solitudinis]|uniref:GntR family transcriptional regulator n=1 Tax=Bacillus solitudinis TaxID=2014074 RepID=UPI000C23A4CB|nr:GntR family transcriptional regulator [Bacillus solitudinis]
MFITIQTASQVPLYEQVVEQVKELVAKGIIEEGEKLPSVRDLSSQIVLNPNTVSKAYKELERQGVIITLRGKGTFVADASKRMSDPRKREAVKKQIQKLVIEANYADVSKEKFVNWVNKEFQALEGKKSDED